LVFRGKIFGNVDHGIRVFSERSNCKALERGGGVLTCIVKTTPSSNFESAYSFYGEKLFSSSSSPEPDGLWGASEAKTDELSEYEQLRQQRKEQQQQQQQ
jgi:hypothetical protein